MRAGLILARVSAGGIMGSSSKEEESLFPVLPPEVSLPEEGLSSEAQV